MVAISEQQKKYSTGGFGTYKELVSGDSWVNFIKEELYTLFLSNIPGLFGFALRALTLGQIFKSCGIRPAFGRGILLKRPSQISIGNKVMIDDFATIEAKGDGAQITFGDLVSIGKYSIITAKGGSVHLESGVNISTHCRIATQTKVSIGESTLVAAYCYIGPGNHSRGEGPIIEEPMELKGGVVIGKNCWIGAHTTILDGVKIGDGAVIGAHSLVLSDVPPGATAVGAPARIIK